MQGLHISGYYKSIMSTFDNVFFDHLGSVASLTFRAPHEDPLGLDDTLPHASLALKPGQMPNLRCLVLECIYLCQERIGLSTETSVNIGKFNDE